MNFWSFFPEPELKHSLWINTCQVLMDLHVIVRAFLCEKVKNSFGQNVINTWALTSTEFPFVPCQSDRQSDKWNDKSDDKSGNIYYYRKWKKKKDNHWHLFHQMPHNHKHQRKSTKITIE